MQKQLYMQSYIFLSRSGPGYGHKGIESALTAAVFTAISALVVQCVKSC